MPANEKRGEATGDFTKRLEARKDAILRSALDCIITMDHQGRIVDFNPAAERTFGYRREAVIGKLAADTIVPARYRQAHLEGIRRYLKTHEGPILNKRIEIEARRADGSEFFAELVVTDIQLEGEPPFFTAYLRDITERRAFAQELLARNEELLASNRELEQFAYVASHDLQEPLRKIINYGERLEQNMQTDIQKDHFRRMKNAALRMKKVIDDLLQYSRVTRQGKAPFEEIHLKKLLTEVNVDLEVVIQESEAKVILGKHCETIKANPSQMRHLFQNLITNSIKFAKKDVKPVVTVECVPKDDGIEIRVSDNGIGFDEQYLDKIFKPFQRLHRKDEYEGTGIGLAIVHKIVQNHRGQITAKSQEGKGATFIVTLPQ